jgi:phosphatidate cytidylyltransferase
LRTRVLTSIVSVPVVIAFAVIGGGLWAVGVALVAAIGTREAYGLARAGGQRADTWVGYPLAAGLALSGVWSHGDLVRLCLAAGIIAAFVAQVGRNAGERSASDWLATVAYPVAVGGLLGFLVLVRQRPDGLAWTTALLLTVWANDSFAYLGGRFLGRTAFFASLSPHKTREGALVGTVASVAVGLMLPALGALGPVPLAPLAGHSPLALGILGLAVAVAAPAGDLSQSFLKRQVGVKDSGAFFPGHGGILDRLDSIMFAAPVVYAFALLAAPIR